MHTRMHAGDHHDTHHSLCSSEPALRAQRKGQEAESGPSEQHVTLRVQLRGLCEVTHLQSEDSKVTKVKDE